MPGRKRTSGDPPTPPDATGLRRFIFGDRAIDDWPPPDADSEAEPWRSFVAARTALQRGAPAEAERIWRAVAARPGLESRHALQAWYFLRSIGVSPTEADAKRVLGAVVEVAVPDGHDLLAAYADGSVRYLNAGGGATIIDERIPDVDAPARELLASGQSFVDAIGPWEGPLPALPPGHSRLTILTPSGPHFGQGPDAALRSDPMARACFDAATRTLLAVVELTENRRR